MPNPLRSEEEWVRQCMASHMPDCTITQHDDGSAPAMHDLDVWATGERVGAVEISAAVDPEAMQLWKLITMPGQWTDLGLIGGWMVTVTRAARARALKARLPGLLRALESQGRRQVSGDLGDHLDVEADLARTLGIVKARQGPTGTPGSVYVLVELPPERSGGAVSDTADTVADWVSSWLRRADQNDNLRKLNRSGARDRHMVVLVGGLSPAPFNVNYALTSDEVILPIVAPELPDEVTHCWVMSTWSSGRGLVWSPGSWSFFDKLQSRP